MSIRNQAVRFKDIAVGQKFRIEIGGPWTIATKTSPTTMEVPKINSPGVVVFPIDPDLNMDDCVPLEN